MHDFQNCTEWKDAAQELIDANQERIKAYGDRDKLNHAVARIEVATRKLQKIIN